MSFSVIDVHVPCGGENIVFALYTKTHSISSVHKHSKHSIQCIYYTLSSGDVIYTIQKSHFHCSGTQHVQNWYKSLHSYPHVCSDFTTPALGFPASLLCFLTQKVPSCRSCAVHIAVWLETSDSSWYITVRLM